MPEDFEERLRALARRAGLRQPPAGFAGRVMARLVQSEPAPFYWRLAPAALALGCFGAGVLVGRLRPGRAPQPVAVNFQLKAPRAQAVSLAGDFTDWRPAALRRRDGRWELDLLLARGGRYQYIFILNGRTMLVDPAAEEVEQDEKGDFYAVLDTTRL